MSESSLPRRPEPDLPDPGRAPRGPRWPLSGRETGLIAGWFAGAALAVAGVSTWSTGAAYVVAGILVAVIATLALSEVA